ncbi:MAG: rRNA maturation RNase YbeY, partial [Ignavibacteria bacterium]|nr:rRNA maturation RNase YbeY [Ignavibacteria bacterium]
QSINAEYRNLDMITDVISFASQDELMMIDNDSTVELGDIFINIQAIRNQAKEYKHSLKREFCFLVTHGILHLLGYDHINIEDEKKMFKLQEEILYEIARR